MTANTKYDINFFKTKKSADLKKDETQLARYHNLGKIAAEYGYFLYCKVNNFKKVRDTSKIYTTISKKTIIDELKKYSCHDIYKTIFIYSHKRELGLFINDLRDKISENKRKIDEFKQAHNYRIIKECAEIIKLAKETIDNLNLNISLGDLLATYSFDNTLKDKIFNLSSKLNSCLKQVEHSVKNCLRCLLKAKTLYEHDVEYMTLKNKFIAFNEELNNDLKNFKTTFSKRYIMNKNY
ncbi:UNVERIFIED_CONTAM: hypothetical protein O8I53_05545 [Campylobacter lari]